MSDTFLVLVEKGLLLPDLDATPVADRGLCVADGRLLVVTDAGVEGQYLSSDSVENNDLLIQHNLAAGAAPTATDDSAAGYAVGSVWIDTTNDNAYVCVDATATAAVWYQINNTGADANQIAFDLFSGRHRTGNSTYREVSRGVLSTDRLPTTTPELIFEVITAGGAPGNDVRLYDVTNATALAEVTGITTTGIKTATVTLPGSPGDIVWALQHRNPGTGNSEIAGASLQIG